MIYIKKFGCWFWANLKGSQDNVSLVLTKGEEHELDIFLKKAQKDLDNFETL